MKHFNRNRLFFAFTLLSSVIPATIFAADSVQLKVKIEKGAVLREGPNIKTPKLAVLKYGTLLDLIETDPKIQIVQLEMAVQGHWLKVRHGSQVGFIFSALVEDNALNNYQCPVPRNTIKDFLLSRPGMIVEFCADGTYILNNSYICSGPCWEHGCWRVSPKKQLELLRQKVSETRGIGKPISCTHFCTYKLNEIVSESSGNREKWKLAQDMEAFTEYYLSKGKKFPDAADWAYRNNRFTCRDSKH